MALKINRQSKNTKLKTTTLSQVWQHKQQIRVQCITYKPDGDTSRTPSENVSSATGVKEDGVLESSSSNGCIEYYHFWSQLLGAPPPPTLREWERTAWCFEDQIKKNRFSACEIGSMTWERVKMTKSVCLTLGAWDLAALIKSKMVTMW